MAAGDALRAFRNAPYRATFALRDTANELVTNVASVTSQVSVDSGAYGGVAGTLTEIGSSGIHYLDLTAAELTGSNASIRVTNNKSVGYFQEIPFEPTLESGVAQASTSASITLRSGASATDDLFNGQIIEIARGTGQGQSRTIVDYTGSTKIAAVDRDWTTNPDTTSVYAINATIGVRHGTDIYAKTNVEQIDTIAAAATALGYIYQGGVIQTSVNDGSPSTTSWTTAAGLSATDDFYNNAICIFVDGTLSGLARQVSDWDGDTLTITTTAFPSAPSNGDKFVLLGRVF